MPCRFNGLDQLHPGQWVRTSDKCGWIVQLFLWFLVAKCNFIRLERKFATVPGCHRRLHGVGLRLGISNLLCECSLQICKLDVNNCVQHSKRG